ncbi:hypothetical protein KIW84_012848 [Lathyrus oleraceus]|uniref:Uncharacterized protein n=1 Tax=Pisum sativum TaxID=3888 RepID=A0A9D5GWX6_PEA|nr:hypothetical protein KIW84_012848 [Pisum sativum]
MEAVLPVEVQIPSLRIMKEAGLDEDEWIQTRLDQINLIDEKRLAAVCHGQIYQKRMTQAFNKKIQPNVRLILQLRDGLAYDPFGCSSHQMLPSVWYILKCSLAYDYPIHHQIQPSGRLALLLRDGLAYDPFGCSSPQMLPSVRYILKRSLAYDYPFHHQVQPNGRLILQLRYDLVYDPF